MTRRDPDCDPGLLDELKCKARGVKAQAEYNDKNAQVLDKAKLDYEKARAAYSAARAKAEPLVYAARQKLEGPIVKAVKCLVDESDQDCLERADICVAERLKKCGVPRGCCSGGECDYDDRVHGCDPDDVPGHIADITRRTKEATDCFNELIKEPDPGLPDRVKAVVADIDEIEKALADKSWEPSRLYAAVLVARRHLKAVWHGFKTVNDYMECLCHALTCMIRGHAAIGELTRKAAVHECYRESWKAACKRLEEETVDEILAEFIRLCGTDDDDDCDDRSDDCDDGDSGDDDSHGGESDDRDDDEEPDQGSGDYGEPRRPPSRPAPGRPDTGYGERERTGSQERRTAQDRGGRRPYRDERGRYRAP